MIKSIMIYLRWKYFMVSSVYFHPARTLFGVFSVPNCGRNRPMWPNWTVTWPRDFDVFRLFRPLFKILSHKNAIKSVIFGHWPNWPWIWNQLAEFQSYKLGTLSISFSWNLHKVITWTNLIVSWNPHKVITILGRTWWNHYKLPNYFFVKSPQTNCFFVKSPEFNHLDEIN